MLFKPCITEACVVDQIKKAFGGRIVICARKIKQALVPKQGRNLELFKPMNITWFRLPYQWLYCIYPPSAGKLPSIEI